MKRVPGCTSTTVSARPGPRTAICERLARRVLAPKLASPSSMYTKPLKSDGTGLLKAPPRGNSTSRMSPGVLSSTGEPSPTSTRTIASPSCLTGTSCGSRSCALGSDIDPSSARGHSVSVLVDRRLVYGIDLRRLGHSSSGADPLGYLLEALKGTTGEEHSSPRAGEGAGHRATDRPSRPVDHGVLVLE